MATKQPALRTRNDVKDNAKKVSIEVLNATLADIADLTNATRQAHWNVKGTHFAGLHLLFETFYKQLNEHTDTIAERAVQLGGIAEGTTQVIGAKTRLSAYSTTTLDGIDHCRELADRYAEFAKNVREGIDQTDDAGDADTADLLTEVSRDIDKDLWMLEAHLQGKD